MGLTKEVKQEIITKFGSNEKDSGSTEVQIALLTKRIVEEKKFVLWKNAYRYILDVEDMYKICSFIIENKLFLNNSINISYEKADSVVDIVKAIEKIFEKKAKYELVEKGSNIEIDTSMIENIRNKLKITKPDIEYLIRKYKRSY